MTAKEKRGSSFVMQAAILASASLIVRFIGFLYRLPLTELIGDTGNGIYNAGYQIYTFLLILSSAGLPAAISRLVSTRIAKGEFQNAHRVFRVALAFAVTLGSIGMVVLYVFAEQFASWGGIADSVYSIKTLAPTLLIVSIMSVYRGYLQGLNIMVPTAVSQIIEQIFNAIFSVYLAWILVKQSIPLGAAGGTAGTGVGALAGLVIIIIYYQKEKKTIFKNIRFEQSGIAAETNRETLKNIVSTALPIIAGTAIFSMSNLIDVAMVMSNLRKSGAFTEEEAQALYGQLSGKYVTLTTMPVSISSAMAVTVGDRKVIKYKINLALKMAMIIAIPAAVGIGVLGDNILLMLFPSYPEGGVLLKAGAVSIAFLSLCQIVTGVLQGIGKIYIPVIGALIGAIVKIILNSFLIEIPAINVVGAVISTDVCYLAAAAFDLIMLSRITGIRPYYGQILVKPAICSAVMGVSCIVFYKLFDIIFGNTISTLATIILAMGVYLVCMLLIRGITEKDFNSIPKGRSMVRIFKKLRLIR